MTPASTPPQIEALQSVTAEQVEAIARQYGTPVFVYSEAILLSRAKQALAFAAPYGLTVRYAMKANPLAAILRLLDQAGLHIDASSGNEAHRAITAGIAPEHIMITSQQIPDDLAYLVLQGVIFNATSLYQLECYGRQFPGSNVSVRLNPGIGSGHSRKTNTGGPASSFGIWHEDIPEVKRISADYNLTVTRIHTHIGAGTDPKIWHEAARLTLDLAEHFSAVTTINLGGGFKVARMSYEEATNLVVISAGIAKLIEAFAQQTGRRLHLEIEPGTYLTANAGALITRVIDCTSTGAAGYNFLKLDCGLTEIMRPSLYGAQHPIIILNTRHSSPTPYIVVGHTCESGDLLTPEPGQADIPAERLLQHASIGDVAVIEGVGAYCASMSAKGYNSFPDTPEIMLSSSGETKLARRPFTSAEIIAREL